MFQSVSESGRSRPRAHLFGRPTSPRCWGAVALLAAATVAHAAVDIVPNDDGFTVSIDGRQFAKYDRGVARGRPFFREIRAGDGALLTRPIAPLGGDHPHHTGVWIAIDKVNGVEFWHLDGRIENQSIEVTATGASRATVVLKNDWRSPAGQKLLDESTTIEVHASRLMVFNILLTAVDESVTFGDTEEGFFAFRMADALCEERTGEVVNADGRRTAKSCWGRTSNWVDYSGQIDGQVYGAAIFDHPLNFRPGRYHVRDYGLFSISPFGESDYTKGRRPAKPVTLEPGASLRLQYGLYFHQGNAVGGQVAAAYERFLQHASRPSMEEREVQIRSTADGTMQPAMFMPSSAEAPAPLLVALHTWSGDYRQDYNAAAKKWCQQHGWSYVHPNFRGPNRRPAATGSDLAVQDVVDAVTYASARANVDPTRIYLVGASGGGHMALLMASRHPEIWAGVSSWVPVVDLAAWYLECRAANRHYWQEVAASCGGIPGASDEVDQQYERRSPIAWLEAARGVSLDINAGIRDGHEGSVPISHALRAFDEVAYKDDRFTEEEIETMVREAKVPPHLEQPELDDPTYGERRPLLRREAGPVRITLFDGGHEMVPSAALAWLAKQRLVRRPSPAVGSSQLPRYGPYFPVDDRVIEDRWRLRRFVVPGKRHAANPVLERKFDWEGTGPMPQTVLRDPADGRLKMWYTVWNETNYDEGLPFSYNVCYAESDDGLQWRRPILGIFDDAGSTENNCVRLGRFKSQNVDIELVPESWQGEGRFLALHNDKGGLFLTTSQDGKTFSFDPAANVVAYHSDTHNNFVYDEARNRWLMYLRPRAFAGAGVRYDPPRNGESKVGRRRVAVRESQDLRTWSSTHTVLVPAENDPEYFYGMTVFRRGDLFFGMLQRYTTKTHEIVMELAFSGDGITWHRLPVRDDAVWLDVGPPGRWDAGMVMTVDRPVEMGDDLWFYYGGHDKTHQHRDSLGAVGIATTRRDRLVAVEDLGRHGRLLTRPLPVAGDLCVNAQIGGTLRVSVHGADDRVLPGWSADDCTPLTGDSLRARIAWGDKTLSDLEGQVVRLRFHFDNAKLFAFDFCD